MAEDEAQAPPERPLLRNAKIIEVVTDEEGFINIKVELPEEALFRVNANVVGMAYLVGTITRFLGTLLENSAKGVMDNQDSKEIRDRLSLPGREN